ncbi:MAG: hypothetical protein HKN17_00745 [Rhodothermales bacterium]|nr:hypothetical protein [Rhodothermales bacterium]
MRALLIALLIVLPSIGCGGGSGFERNDVRIMDVELTRLQSGARIITGRIENGSPGDISGLQIQVSLFDGDNRRVDGMSITVRNLEAGEVRAFREPVDSDFDVRGVRVRSLLFP